MSRESRITPARRSESDVSIRQNLDAWRRGDLGLRPKAPCRNRRQHRAVRQGQDVGQPVPNADASPIWIERYIFLPSGVQRSLDTAARGPMGTGGRPRDENAVMVAPPGWLAGALAHSPSGELEPMTVPTAPETFRSPVPSSLITNRNDSLSSVALNQISPPLPKRGLMPSTPGMRLGGSWPSSQASHKRFLPSASSTEATMRSSCDRSYWVTSCPGNRRSVRPESSSVIHSSVAALPVTAAAARR